MDELLKQMLPDGPEFVIEERAITLDQIRNNHLQDTWQETKKKKNPHYPAFAKRYGKDAPSYELDALPAPVLRQLVREAIQEHVSDADHAEELAEQEADRTELRGIVDRLLKKDVPQPDPWAGEADVWGDDPLDESDKESFSLMITQAQKAQLRELGYTDEQIREMTPAAAHKILGLE